jgi:hypothetical protein
MKKLKIFFWIVTLLTIGLVFIQNRALFLAEQSLSIKLFLYEFSLPALKNGTILLFIFFCGALLAEISSLLGRFKARKALRKCKINVEGYLEKIGELNTQLDQLKVRYSPKGVVHEPSGMGTDLNKDRAVA